LINFKYETKKKDENPKESHEEENQEKVRKKETTRRNMNAGVHADEGVKQDQEKSSKERMGEKNK
jgi:hypothetical protein